MARLEGLWIRIMFVYMCFNIVIVEKLSNFPIVCSTAGFDE